MLIQGNIVSEQSAFYGEIDFDQSINTITKKAEIKSDANWILPGFIDLHVHGGGGADIMEGANAIRTMLRTHLKNGTTSLLATTVTETQNKLIEVFKSVKEVMSTPKSDEARLLGVHLEGPYLSSHKLGAQPNYVRPLSLQEIKELHEIAPIRIITIAPESGLDSTSIKSLNQLGIKVQLGHSNASYEDSAHLLAAGVESVTHLFNAMSSMHHRAPGLVGATLANANRAEIIPDLLHVHPGAIKVALRAIPDLYFVTDATAATGMPDGDYKLGPHKVHKCANGVRLADGTLAGSSLTMIQALKNAHSLGLDIISCAKRLATIQSQLIAQRDCGSLVTSKRADLVITSAKFDLQDVFLAGKKI